MRRIIILAIAFLIGSPALFAQTKAGRKDTTQHVSYYTCPMHPDISSDKPGKCPKCGMKLGLSNKEQMKAKVAKNYSCPIHPTVTSHDPGKCPQCGRKLNVSPKEQLKVESMKIYTCPMHPDVALNKEGKCSKCGATLVEKKNKKG